MSFCLYKDSTLKLLRELLSYYVLSPGVSHQEVGCDDRSGPLNRLYV